MAYFLRKTNKKKGTYLQICETTYNPETKKSSNKNYLILGYENELKKTYENPIEHFKNTVKELNEKEKENRVLKVSTTPITTNIGYFLIKSVLNTLNIKQDLDLMGQGHNFENSISEFIEAMIYCQIVKPSSKLKNAQDILPSLHGVTQFSEDQIYRMINFVGTNYKKYIEIFNKHIGDLFPFNFTHAFFDCTNFYFEIDLPKDDKQKGPSKENRKSPIIGQALLLDGNQMPIDMEMYPGNESEKPYIRKLIENMKAKTNVEGRTIQVADKGLNCAKNIYSAAFEAKDGYVFSKSVHGNNLSKVEKTWVLLDDDGENKWTNFYDKNGKLLYRLKSCIDNYSYEFVDDNGQKIKFSAKEKRVLSYNPDLARKRICEIDHQVDQVLKKKGIKGIKRSEFGDCVKYANFNTTIEGAEIEVSLNEDKINEDKKYAGYNLIITSETKLSDKEIYSIYHGLWRIEESFRITKSYLDARPVYLQTKESIYGHFLICYLALTILRLLEFKIFEEKLYTSDLVNFIRSFNITAIGDHYLSNILNTNNLQIVKQVTQLTCIDNAYLYKKNIDRLLKYEFFVH